MSSQSGSSDVSKKLKAAIRAKLEELGVYVDDELPDYIMVMIANKKEKPQMKEDLNLFIGKNTAKFVDWLFDLFDRLQNASKPSESSKKEEEKKKEIEQKEHEEKSREEKHRKEREEKEKERELQREKEREKERQRERDREKRQEEDKRREERRREAQKTKSRRRTRSRSNTYSDEESNIRIRERDRRNRDHHRGRSPARKRLSSPRHASPSPDRKMSSTVVVKRNIRPSGDSETGIKGRGSMFLRAMNEASVSAGYGPRRSSEKVDEDDMSDVEALPSKPTTKSPKKSIHERMSRVSKPDESMEDDSVVLGNQPATGGPQMILKLTGGREAIKRTRIQDRIVVDDSLRRGLLKRKVEASDEPKSKHDRIVFDLTSNHSGDSTPSEDSTVMQKWNGHIKLGDDSDSTDEEAEIDAVLAEARGISRRDSIREEEDELRPTHLLSGKSYAAAIHINPHMQPSIVPAYIPTPLSVLQEQQNQLTSGFVKEDHFKERCIFWPKCTKGDTCAYMHPTKNCTNFPNCTFGSRCLYIHPPCRFDRFCTKKHCPFTHNGTGGVQPGQYQPPTEIAANPLTSNRLPVARPPVEIPKLDDLPKPTIRGALGSLAEKLAASLKKKSFEKKEDKEDENKDDKKAAAKIEEKEPTAAAPEPERSSSTNPPIKALPEIAPLQNMIHCRYAAGCRNPVCHFKHPKECRFGANCRNASCYFYHKPTPAPAPIAPGAGDAATAKYKWTATAP